MTENRADAQLPTAAPYSTAPQLPSHIAFIMDGNGRWAKGRGLPREAGHKEGAKVFRNLVEYCGDIGIPCVTVYAFSTENWRRPAPEVRAILALLRLYIRDAFRTFVEKDIRIVFLGDKSPFPAGLRKEMERLERDSAGKRKRLNVALNYGGRAEIVRAAQRLAEQNVPAAEITEERLAAELYTYGCPDPDLIVRTAGELRLSNFLLWQSAYAEFYVTDTLWPDMRTADVDRAIEAYNGRTRRFGAVV